MVCNERGNIEATIKDIAEACQVSKATISTVPLVQNSRIRR